MKKLKQISIILIFPLFTYCSCATYTDEQNSIDISKTDNSELKVDSSLNGLYVGFEIYGSETDSNYPGRKYKLGHWCKYKIKGDSIFLDKHPVKIHKNDTLSNHFAVRYYFYKGTFTRTDTSIEFSLKELVFDQSPPPDETLPDQSKPFNKRSMQLIGRLAENGFILNGSKFERTTKKFNLLKSEHPEL